MRVTQLMTWTTAGAAVMALASCGQSTQSAAVRSGCIPAPIHTGPPPTWTAGAWSDSSPGFRMPYALATGQSAAAFMFGGPLRAGHPTDPANKVLWVMRYPRNGKPLLITARSSNDPSLTVRLSRAADSSPGEIYPTYVDMPHPGCWKLALRWGMHRASIDVTVQASTTRSRAPYRYDIMLL